MTRILSRTGQSLNIHCVRKECIQIHIKQDLQINEGKPTQENKHQRNNKFNYFNVLNISAF